MPFPPSPPQIQILPCTRADLPTLAALFSAAFIADPFLTIIYAGCDAAALQASTLQGFEEGFDTAGAVWLKAVDERGAIVGFSKWEYPHAVPAARGSDDAAEAEATILATPPVPGSKHALVLEYRVKFHRARTRYRDPARDLFMAMLVVDPACQRRGIGRMLLQPGLDFADGRRARAYVQASKPGEGLYRKCGWEQIDVVEVDFGEGGVIGRTALMMREPRGA